MPDAEIPHLMSTHSAHNDIPNRSPHIRIHARRPIQLKSINQSLLPRGRYKRRSFIQHPPESLTDPVLIACVSQAAVTIDILPDDVVLEMISFYLADHSFRWCTLVHVCRRWRSIVFSSPLRLDLQIICTVSTPAREKLDVWPALPISILGM